MSKQEGFTITELLVAVSVAAIASVLVVTAFVFTYASVIREQTKTSMIRESQLFLKRMVDDIRVASVIKTTNVIDDPSESGTGGEWVTSDPANILLTTQPATDNARDLVFDTTTGYPYYHEIIYFGRNGKMYRRTLRNSAATGSVQQTTCPTGTPSCSPDIELLSNLDNMQFEFYDINDVATPTPELARSVQISINLRKRVSGQDIVTTNTTRVTMRNEN